MGAYFQESPYLAPQLKLTINIDDKGVYAIAENLPGLIVSSKSLEDLPEAVFDALLVYYDIPRYQARKIEPNISITLHDGQVLTTQSKEQLNY